MAPVCQESAKWVKGSHWYEQQEPFRLAGPGDASGIRRGLSGASRYVTLRQCEVALTCDELPRQSPLKIRLSFVHSESAAGDLRGARRALPSRCSESSCIPFWLGATSGLGKFLLPIFSVRRVVHTPGHFLHRWRAFIHRKRLSLCTQRVNVGISFSRRTRE